MGKPGEEQRRRHREVQARYYRRHRNKVTARERTRYHRNRLRECFRKACDRAVSRGAEPDLTQEQWEFVLEHYGHRCAYTGEQANGVPLEIEHVMPLNLGGKHALGNVVPALRAINTSKFTADPADWMAERGIDQEEFFARLAACTQAWESRENDREIEELRAGGKLGAVLE